MNLDLEANSAILQRLDHHLPDLDNFTYGPVEDLGVLDASLVVSSLESIDLSETFDADIWSFSNVEKGEKNCAEIKSWEAFHDNSFQEPGSTYIGEAGPDVFDALLSTEFASLSGQETRQHTDRVNQSKALLNSLFQLGFGRESILYYYCQAAGSFRARIEDGRISGYSLEVLNNLSAMFTEYGNRNRQLHSFVDEIQSQDRACPALVALGSAFSSLLMSLEVRVTEEWPSVRSLLQLQSLWQEPRDILVLMSEISKFLDGAQTDEELLSRLYDYVLNLEHTDAWTQPIAFDILTIASEPWLNSVSSWIGLNPSPSLGQRPDFGGAENDPIQLDSDKEDRKTTSDDETFARPNFISTDDARLISEIGQSIRLLETHRPDHPLIRRDSTNPRNVLGLSWQGSWESIERVQAKAKEYELRVQRAIHEFDKGCNIANVPSNIPETLETPETNIETSSLSEETARKAIADSIAQFNQPLPSLSSAHTISQSVSSRFRGPNDTAGKQTFAPPLSLLSALSFNPLLWTQSHLANRACLRLLFKEYNIRSHFSLLYRYSLLGDGVFASRLANALFDPELQSSECRKGYSRIGRSGLRLGSRDTWPPASSELRLALMGILSDSYHREGQDDASSIFRAELPGGLSFSIRDMSEDDLRRCIDPNSIEALNFLRLQYRPPPPLNAIITDSSLLRYDAIFKLLLRAVRMLFVVNNFRRETRDHDRCSRNASRHFRIGSHHFVSTLCAYFFDGVQTSWAILEQRLQELDTALDRDSTGSMVELCEFHDQVLDHMMFALMLRKRQAHVMKLVEEIFSLILQFAQYTQSENRDDNREAKVSELHNTFGKKVRVFLNVCRGLNEHSGYGGIKGSGQPDGPAKIGNMVENGSNTINQLLLKFELSEFYTR